MVESFIRQLKSTEVLERRQAVVKITNSGHPEALAILEKYLRIEQDGEIRALTEKAIQYLKTNKPAANGANVPASPKQNMAASSASNSGVFINNNRVALATPAAPPAVPIGTLPPPKPISEQQKNLAKGKLDSAMQFQMSGKPDEALLALKRAFELNPALEKDSFAHGLASALTGGSGEDPIELVKRASKPTKNKGKADPSGQPQSAFSGAGTSNIVVEGATTALNFGIELAIIAIIFIIYFVLAYRKFTDIATALVQYAALRGVSSASLGTLDLFTSSTRQALLVSAITQGVTATVSSLIQAFLMYVVGILIGGTGKLLDFLRTVMRVTAVVYLAIGAVFLIFPATSWLPLDPVTQQQTSFNPAILIGIISLVGGILWVYFAGRAHGFGFFKGCAMIVLTSIGFTVLVFIVLMLAGPRMTSNLPGMIMPILNLR